MTDLPLDQMEAALDAEKPHVVVVSPQEYRALIAAVRERDALREELKLWRMLVNEGGVPRYTITPGAALNTIVTSTDALLRRTTLEGSTK